MPLTYEESREYARLKGFNPDEVDVDAATGAIYPKKRAGFAPQFPTAGPAGPNSGKSLGANANPQPSVVPSRPNIPDSVRRRDATLPWWVIGLGIGIFAWLMKRRNENGASQKSKAPPRSDGHQNKNPNSTTFICFSCKGVIRVETPEVGVRYGCPSCNARFTIEKTGSPPTFVVVPEGAGYQANPEPPDRDFPNDVNSALKVLGIVGPATFDQIRLAYRELVKAYHPDRVAHLGPELRRLAESKTKEINAAYRFLQGFYGSA